MESSSIKNLALSAIVLGLLNFTILSWFVWERLVTPAPTQPSTAQVLPTPPPVVPVTPLTASSSPELAESLAQIEDRLTTLEEKPVAVKSANSIKETFLYLGSGSSTSRDWTTIDSASVKFNTATYGRIKEIRFEAAMSIISGEVHARLANKSTGAVYHNSIVTHNKSTSEWKTSEPIVLPSGNYEYVVQLRSSNGERANLDGARLKIIVE